MTHRTASSPTKIFAHRGTTQAGAPENSIRAATAAFAAHADGIELDIRRTKDNVLLCLHDADILGVPISQLNWSDIESINHAHGLEIPRLEEILSQIPHSVLLDIELKIPGIAHLAIQQLLAHRYPESFVVTSFLDAELKKTKEVYPNIRTGLILGKKDPSPWLKTRRSELFPKHRLRESHADFVVPHWRLLHFGFLKRMHQGGWPVWLWTVNAPHHLRRWINRSEIEVVISDNVSLCRTVRSTSR